MARPESGTDKRVAKASLWRMAPAGAAVSKKQAVTGRGSLQKAPCSAMRAMRAMCAMVLVEQRVLLLFIFYF